MQDEVKDKDLEGCTFQPAIYSVEEGYQKRNLDQFLEDQKNFVTKVTKKIEDVKIRASQMEETNMHPTIDETSRKIVEEKLTEKGRYNKPIHERLYDLNQELIDKKKIATNTENNKFKAQQSIMEQAIQRRDNLDQILYDDAKRRRDDNVKAKVELDKVRDTPTGKPYHNPKSDKFVQQRFNRELKTVQEELLITLQVKRQSQVALDPATALISFPDTIDMLTRLGFLPRNKAPDAHEEALCSDLWTMIQGDKNNGVTLDTLRVVMLNFIGIRTKDREVAVAGQSYATIDVEANLADGDEAAEKPIIHDKVDVSKLGFFEGPKFLLKKGDHKKLFTHFKSFYVHRVQFVGLDHDHRQSMFDTYDPASEIMAKPKISQKTTDLAVKKRGKLLGGIDATQVRQVDIFLIPKMDKGKIEAKKKELEDREVEGCTFTPTTLNYRTSKTQVTHGDRCMDLYSRKQKGWFKERGHKTQEDYEFERSKGDLTFSPQINDPEQVQRLAKNRESRKVDTIRGMDKVRDRMERARQQQLEKKLATDRGMPS